MGKKFFITGTDTDVGKTYYSVKLLREYAKEGYSTLGYCDSMSTVMISVSFSTISLFCNVSIFPFFNY